MITKNDLVEYCDFSDPLKVYMLSVLTRKKDNPAQTERDKIKRAHQLIVHSEESLLEACDILASVMGEYSQAALKSRMYMSVNRRDLKKGVLEMAMKMVKCVAHPVPTELYKLGGGWKSILTKPVCRADRRFLFDVDTTDKIEQLKVYHELKRLTEVIIHTETPNGMHFVTEPFNPNLFDYPDKPVDISIKKDDLLLVGWL